MSNVSLVMSELSDLLGFPYMPPHVEAFVTAFFFGLLACIPVFLPSSGRLAGISPAVRRRYAGLCAIVGMVLVLVGLHRHREEHRREANYTLSLMYRRCVLAVEVLEHKPADKLFHDSTLTGPKEDGFTYYDTRINGMNPYDAETWRANQIHLLKRLSIFNRHQLALNRANAAIESSWTLLK